MWPKFDLHYSFFELKNVNWDTLRAAYRPGAVAAPSDVAFAAQLGAMLRQLKDVHVSLTTAGAGSTFAYISPFDTIATNFSAAVTLQNYVTRAAQTTGHHVEYGLAAPTVGYVRIASFDGGAWDGEMDEAIAAMPQAEHDRRRPRQSRWNHRAFDEHRGAVHREFPDLRMGPPAQRPEARRLHGLHRGRRSAPPARRNFAARCTY